MKIALLSPAPVPFIFGGMERFLAGLANALGSKHPTDLITLPCDERTPSGIAKGYYDFYNLDLQQYDLVISTKAPAFMAQHPMHVLYLAHRMRVFYDRYEARDSEHAHMRQMIHWLDQWALSPERIPFAYTIGKTVSQRLLKWGGTPSTPIHLPTTLPIVPSRPGEYFFAAGRLHPWKRFDLIIKAYLASGVEMPLKIAGSGPQEDLLKILAGGDSRIEFLGHVEERVLSELYAGAFSTIFPPIQEDLGLVTFESFQCGKPVLTVQDSGEPSHIVEDGKTGYIVDPTPEAMGAKIRWMADHRSKIEEMAPACLNTVKNVSWDRIVDTLLDAAEKTKQWQTGKLFHIGLDTPLPRELDRIRLLVTDNQMIDPPVGGGRIRIWELYRHLPSEFVTTYVGTHDHPGPAYRDQWMAPNFREIVMPLTSVHFKMHEVWRRLTGGDATIDVTMPMLTRYSPRYMRLIQEYLTGADAVICSHPWMSPWLPDLGSRPLLYDSHNCEAEVKAPLLRRTVAGKYLASKVEKVERALVNRCQHIMACSPNDAQSYENHYGVAADKISLIPNGVDCERFRPVMMEAKEAIKQDLELSTSPLGVFVGSAYPPNIAAVEFLVHTFAPAVPEMTVAIVGGVGPAWQEAAKDAALPENIRILGIVDDSTLDRLYQAAEFGLNPMMHGSGTNIKMLDYMACGLTVITTPTGARGIGGEDDRHWCLRELDDFIPTAQELLKTPDRSASLGEEARRWVEMHFDWRVVAQTLAEQLHRLLPNKPRPGVK